MRMPGSPLQGDTGIPALTKHHATYSNSIQLQIWPCASGFEQFDKTTRICNPHSRYDLAFVNIVLMPMSEVLCFAFRMQKNFYL